MENSSGLYEIRVEVGSDIYKVFSFFDKGKLVVLVNGFKKKIQKTPKKEIELAEKPKKQYFDEKTNNNLTSFADHLDSQYGKQEHQKEKNLKKNLKRLNWTL